VRGWLFPAVLLLPASVVSRSELPDQPDRGWLPGQNNSRLPRTSAARTPDRLDQFPGLPPVRVRAGSPSGTTCEGTHGVQYNAVFLPE